MAEEPTMSTTTPRESSASSFSSSSQQPSGDTVKQHTQVPAFLSFVSPDGNFQMLPVMYPGSVPGFLPQHLDQEQMNRGPGIYAVPVHPFIGPSAGFCPNTLIPFTYNVPTASSSLDSEAPRGDQGQVGHQQPQPQEQPPAPQRQVVVRRFQIAIHIDLFLILKLAAVVFLFNRDGSKRRLTLLIFFATLIYLYQTGALTPLVRWLSQRMQRAAAPNQPPRPAAPAAGREGNEDAAEADGHGRGDNDVNREGLVVEDAGDNRLLGIVKEIRLIVLAFITSLLPGFHHID